jgi:hypothetical protein
MKPLLFIALYHIVWRSLVGGVSLLFGWDGYCACCSVIFSQVLALLITLLVFLLMIMEPATSSWCYIGIHIGSYMMVLAPQGLDTSSMG